MNLLPGISLTLLIIIVAQLLTALPLFTTLGPLVLAIILGMIIKQSIGTPANAEHGILFSTKTLLRVGIVLLGLRLQFNDLFSMGVDLLLYATITVVFGIGLVVLIGRLFRSSPTPTFLIGAGTGICGASAIAAVGTQLRVKQQDIAIAVAVISITGTLFTLIFTLMYPYLQWTDEQYGLFVGGVLHEIGHVTAASSVASDAAMDAALLIKLTRVLLLVPVVIIIAYVYKRKDSNTSSSPLPFPWFIIGFLLMSILVTYGNLPDGIVNPLVQLAYVFIGMAMAGLGLQIKLSAIDPRSFTLLLICILASLLLSGFGMLYVTWFL
ncbi:YeiH family protein [Geomicrobium sp. JCM 19055]|uniref:YeiH family protein n=1 Tax=Geomicrobium sp. JCM 19055 TaxID=1460649 RepID=UPI00045ED01C|nr:putative sulfate exporter family transporter [Geomicrobium sp. JCM 19055]GAK00532.1 putative membrane protein YeiH [Geomicrobium sp. JCM 19055]